MIYWIMIIITVFLIMHFKVGVGYVFVCHNILLQCGGSFIKLGFGIYQMTYMLLSMQCLVLVKLLLNF